jgi:hypothetical protein
MIGGGIYCENTRQDLRNCFELTKEKKGETNDETTDVVDGISGGSMWQCICGGTWSSAG